MRSRSTSAVRTCAAAVMAASAVTSGACYRYTPIDSSSPALGSEVRLRLTDAGAITMAPLVGNRIEVVDGHVSSVADTSVTLSVTGTTDRLGSEVTWKGEQVVFPRIDGGRPRAPLARQREELPRGRHCGRPGRRGRHRFQHQRQRERRSELRNRNAEIVERRQPRLATGGPAHVNRVSRPTART